MKVGLGSYAFRWAFKAGMSISDFLKASAGLGAAVVQLCENSGIDRVPEKQLDELATIARDLGLAIECGGSGGADREQLERAVRRTAALGGTIYRCVLDSDGAAPEAVIGNLRHLVPILHECGVVLCAENHFRFTPRTLRRIIEEINDPAVGVCLDPLNSIAQWVGPEETIRELLPFARTAHIKDARIQRKGFAFVIDGVPLGEGDMDVSGYLTAIEPRVETVLLESWMSPIDGESGHLTLQLEALWATNGLELIRKLVGGTPD